MVNLFFCHKFQNKVAKESFCIFWSWKLRCINIIKIHWVFCLWSEHFLYVLQLRSNFNEKWSHIIRNRNISNGGINISSQSDHLKMTVVNMFTSFKYFAFNCNAYISNVYFIGCINPVERGRWDDSFNKIIPAQAWGVRFGSLVLM